MFRFVYRAPLYQKSLSPTATPKPHLGTALSPTGVALFPTSPGIAEREGKGYNTPAAHRLEGHLVPLCGLSARSTARSKRMDRVSLLVGPSPPLGGALKNRIAVSTCFRGLSENLRPLLSELMARLLLRSVLRFCQGCQGNVPKQQKSPMAPPTPPAARGPPPSGGATGPPQHRGTGGCRGQQRAPEQGASDTTIGSIFFLPSSASPVAPPTPPVARAPPPGESATGPPLRSASTLPPMATPMPHLAASPSPTDVALFPTTPGIAEGKGKGGNKPAAHRPEEHLVPPRGLFAHSTAL